MVVVLLAMDFWNCRVRLFKFGTIGPMFHTRSSIGFQNVAGRTLVGLRFWNQVCCLHIFRASRFGIENLTHDGVGK
jgi:hypothetical protein